MKEIKAYIYDWDDNILHMDTKINMEKLVNGSWESIEVSTANFATARKDDNYRIPLLDGSPNYDKAFSNFRDFGKNGDDAFMLDCIEAIDNHNVAGSYLSFKKCLIDASLFIICTARGHEPNSLRKGVDYFITSQINTLESKLMCENIYKLFEFYNYKIDKTKSIIEYYLNKCHFIGVSSSHFINSVKDDDVPNGHIFTPKDTELGKVIAIEKFVKQIYKLTKDKNEHTIKIGFSDDDLGNVKAIKDIFENRMKKMFPNINFVVYDTSKNEDGTKNYKKILV